MFDYTTAGLIVCGLLFLVLIGVHVAVSLGIASVVGIYLVTGKLRIVEATLASTSAEALRDFTFAVIPLFMLMGEFMGRSGAITDIYVAINKGLRRIPARLAIATVLGNTVFSFVTGVSIASAAAFSRIAYPEMKAHNYHRGFSLGAIAGSSCLGMLIPPSVLMIVWGILTEQSIGRLFLAGVLPGILLATFFIVYIVLTAVFKPEMVGEGKAHAEPNPEMDTTRKELPARQFATSLIGVIGIISAVLGGIWWGVFTPTEGAGAGAALALVLALTKGMNWNSFVQAIYQVGKTAAPIMILLLAAALYSRTLAMTGITTAIRTFFEESGLDPYMVLTIIVIVWFVLGMIIDSISIMLLTVPIVEPVAMAFGFDQLSFAILGIIAIEAGLLTPPFGLLVYTVKAAIQDRDIGVQAIFKSSIPYWGIMLLMVLLLAAFPQIANTLPNALM
ncbi:TRAP transporter large permease subunit [Labrenzia sp. CE80]|uniref:TRAP transporter large permease n=1 Tax=Labrenzia sp. CE80 TaxID=1788986 RepID=UPI00129BA9B2|nr:TRAP transporter large permease subunit [Labrenzia sp. CE80]